MIRSKLYEELKNEIKNKTIKFSNNRGNFEMFMSNYIEYNDDIDKIRQTSHTKGRTYSSWYEYNDGYIPKIENGKFGDGRHVNSDILQNIFNFLYKNDFEAVDISMYNGEEDYEDEYDEDEDYPMEGDGEIVFEFQSLKNPDKKVFVSAVADFDYLYENSEVNCRITIINDEEFEDPDTLKFRKDFSVIESLFDDEDDDFRKNFKVIGSYCLDGDFNDIDIVCYNAIEGFKLKQKAKKKNIKIQIILRSYSEFEYIQSYMTFRNDCFVYDIYKREIVDSGYFKNTKKLEFNYDSIDIFKNYLVIEEQIEKKLSKGYYL